MPARRKLTKKNTQKHLTKDVYKSVSQAASFLRVSSTTLRRLEQKNKIISIRNKNGYRLFKQKDLEALKIQLTQENNSKKELKKRKVRNVLTNKKKSIRRINITNTIINVTTNIFKTFESKYFNNINSNFNNIYIKSMKILISLKRLISKIFLLDLISKNFQVWSFFTKLINNNNLLTKNTFLTVNKTNGNLFFKNKTYFFNLYVIAFIALNTTLLHTLVLNRNNIDKNIISNNVLGFSFINNADESIYSENINTSQDIDINDPQVLAITDRIQEFVFSIDVPTLINSNLNVSGTSTLNNIVFEGEGTIQGLLNADQTTIDTLERVLNINGDVIGEDLTNVTIANGVINEDNLAQTIEYQGDWNFTNGFSINGTEFTADLDNLNTLSENINELNSLTDNEAALSSLAGLEGSLSNLSNIETALTSLSDNETELSTLASIQTSLSNLSNIESQLTSLSNNETQLTNLANSQIESGGIAFGNGTSYSQDVTNLFYNNLTKRLGIGTSSPMYTLDINGTAQISDNIILGGTNISLSGQSTTFKQETYAGNIELLTSVEGDIKLTTGSNGLITLTPSNEFVYVEGRGLLVNEAGNLLIANAQNNIVQIGTNIYDDNLLNVDGDIGIGDALFFNNTSGGINNDSSYGLRADNGTIQFKNENGIWNDIPSALGLTPAGTDGAIQFTDGNGNFVADSTNFNFNDTDNYLTINAIRSIGATNPLYITDHTGSGGLTIINGGSVGIANTNPNFALDVTGSINASSDLYIGSIGLGSTATNSGATLIGIDFGSLNNAPTATNIQQALEDIDSVLGAAAGDIQAVGSVTSGEAFNSIATADGQWLGLGENSARITFSTAPGNAQVQLLGGNIGIGTTNAQTELDVDGEIRASKYSFNSNTYLEQLNNSILLNTNNINRLAITQEGLIGIGTTLPNSALTIQPSTNVALSVMNYGSSSGQTGELRFYSLDNSYIGFKAADSSPGNQVYTLPPIDGLADQVLTTDGSGNLTWQTAEGVGGTNASGTITSVGSITSGAAFSDATADNQWLGLGSNAGQILFNDDTTDKISILNAYFGIGTSNPSVELEVAGDILATNIQGTSFTDGTATLTSGSITGLSNLTMNGTLDITSGTIDLGTNTIYDGNFTGDWNFNNSNISNVLSIGTTNLTSSGTITGNIINANTANLATIGSTNITVTNTTTTNLTSLNTANLLNVATTNITSTGLANLLNIGTTNINSTGTFTGDIINANTGNLATIGATNITATNTTTTNLTSLDTANLLNVATTNITSTGTANLLNIGTTNINSTGTFTGDIINATTGNLATIGATNLTATNTTTTNLTSLDTANLLNVATTNITSTGTANLLNIGTTNINSTGTFTGDIINANTGNLATIGSTNITATNTTTTNLTSLSTANLLNVATTNITSTGTITTPTITATTGNLATIGTTNLTATNTITTSTINASTGNLATIGSTNLSVTNNVNLTGLSQDTQNTILGINTATGLLSYRNIDTRVFNDILVDGTGVSNYLARWNDNDTLTIGSIYDNGTSVGIGTTNLSAALTLAPSTTNAIQINATTSGTEPAELRFMGSNNSNYTGFKAPASLTEDIIYTLPLEEGLTNYVLATDGNGNLSWQSVTGVGAGDIDGTGIAGYLSQWQDSNTIISSPIYSDSTNIGIGTTSLTSALNITPNGLSAIQINPSSSGPSQLRFVSDNNSNYVSLKSPTGLTENIEYVLPSGSGASNYVLATDGSGNLSWQSVTGVGAGNIDGSGVTNYLARWSDSDTLTIGAIYDNGTNVGIGTTDTTATLNIGGSLIATSSIEGTSLTDGTATLTSGSITGLSNLTMNGTLDITTGTIDLGTNTIYDGNFTGDWSFNNSNISNVLSIGTTNLTSSGTITGNIINANTANLATIGATNITATNTTTTNLTSLDTANLLNVATTNITTTNLTSLNTANLLNVATTNITSTGTANLLNIGTTDINSTGTFTGDIINANTGNLATIGSTNITATNTTTTNLTSLDTANLLNVATTSITATNTITTPTINASTGNLATVGSTNLSVTNNVNFTGLAQDTQNSILGINTATGLLSYRNIDERIFNDVLVDGSGVSNYLARWSDTDTLTTGAIYDNGTNVGIGTTDTSATLNIGGSLIATSSIEGTSLTDGTATLTSGSITGLSNLTMSGTLDITSGTIDLGTNTIYDGNFTGNWSFNNSNISNVLSIGTTNLTSTGTITGNTINANTANLATIGTTNITATNTTTTNLTSLDTADLLNVATTNITSTGTITTPTINATNANLATIGATNLTATNTTTTNLTSLDTANLLNVATTNITSTGTANLLNIGTTDINSTGTFTGDIINANTGNLATIGSTNITATNTTTTSLTSLDTANLLNISTTSITATNTITTPTINASTGNLATVGSTNLSVTNNVNFTGLGTGTFNSVLGINTATGLLTYREIDQRVWGDDLIGGTGVTNYLARWSDNNLGIGSIYDTGSLVGIGLTNMTARLEIQTQSAQNTTALRINQIDTTSNPDAVEINNLGTGTSLLITQGVGASNVFSIDYLGNVVSSGTTGITLNSDADLTIGSIGIRDIGTTFNDSGAYLIGFNTATTNYVLNNNVQQAIEQIDAQVYSLVAGGLGTITSVGSITSGNAFSDATSNGEWLGLGANAGRLYFADSTTDKLSFLDAYLGVGTSNPLNTLDVSGNAVVGSSYAGLTTAPINGLLVEGVLGLGTSSPLNKLDVSGSAVIGSSFAGLSTAPTNGLLVQGVVGIGTNSITNGFELQVDGDVSIAQNGYINLGTTFGESGYGLRDFGGVIQAKDSGGNWVEIIGGGYWDLIGSSAPTATLAIDQSYAYNLGIGTTAATERLEVIGNIKADSLIFSGDTSFSIDAGTITGSEWSFDTAKIGIGTTSSGTYQLAVQGDSIFNGSLGIGSTEGSYQLFVNGTAGFSNTVNFANGSTYNIDSTGNATFKNIIANGTENPYSGSASLKLGSDIKGSLKLGSATILDDNTDYISIDTDTSSDGDELRIYDNGNLWSNTGTFISGQTDSASTIAFSFDTDNSLSTTGSKLLSVNNNGTEKMYLDANGNLYISGSIISGNGMSVLMTNKSGDTSPVGSIVLVGSTNVGSSFTSTTEPYALGQYGVVVGVGLGTANDVDSDGVCDTDDKCIIAYGGEVNVLVKSTSVSIGDYIFTSDEANKVTTSQKQFDGLIGNVTNLNGITAVPAYVGMMFQPQTKATATASIDKASKYNDYQLFSSVYTQSTAGSDTTVNLSSKGIFFDNFMDTTKYDSINSDTSVSLSTYLQRAGLIGGYFYGNGTTDPYGSILLGSTAVNDIFHYDRNIVDSSKEIQVQLGIDPNWYNGVTLTTALAATSPTQITNNNLSTTYNGALINVAGTYTGGTAQSIYITIQENNTFDYNDYTLYSGTGVAMTKGTSQTLGSSGVSVTFTDTEYNIGDVFKVASWYIEPASSTRGEKREFPERANIISTDSSVDIIDADTQNLFMRFSQGTGYALGSDESNNPTAAEMLNGRLYIGLSGSGSAGLRSIYFDFDKAYLQNERRYTGNFTGLASRNSEGDYNIINTENKLSGNYINDVSARVINTNTAVSNYVQFVATGHNLGTSITNTKTNITYSSLDRRSVNNLSFSKNNANVISYENVKLYSQVENGYINDFSNFSNLSNNFGSSLISSTIKSSTSPLIWSDTGSSLPSAIDQVNAKVVNDTIYVFGGGVSADIYSAPVSDPTNWSDTGSDLPDPDADRDFRIAQVEIIDDYIYMFGIGTDILKAPISDPTNWSDTGSTLPISLKFTQSAVIGDKIYTFGGYDGASINKILVADASDPTNWSDSGSTIPSTIFRSSLQVVGSYIYLYGGQIAGFTIDQNIYRAPVSNPLNWSDTGDNLDVEMWFTNSQVIGDFVYLFGGQRDGGGTTVYMNGIRRAPVSDPSNFESLGAFFTGGWSRSENVIVDDKIYLIHGYGDSGTRSEILSADISDLVGTDINATQSTSHIDNIGNTIYSSSKSGVMVINENNSDSTNNSVKTYTKDYISEEMHGDIKAMWPLNGDNENSDLESVNAYLEMNTETSRDLTAVNITDADTAPGVRGMGYDFNGTDEYLYLNDISWGTTDLKMGTWIYYADTAISTTEMVPFGIGNSSLGLDGATRMGINAWGGRTGQNVNGVDNVDPDGSKYNCAAYNGGWYYAQSQQTIKQQTWEHIVCSLDSEGLKLYLNGQLDTINTEITSIDEPVEHVTLGRAANSTLPSYFEGRLDEAFVTKGDLDESKIKHMYETGLKALNNHSTQLGSGTADGNQTLGISANDVSKSFVDYNNNYMYVATNDNTNGGISKIDLSSDTVTKVFKTTANTPAGGTTLNTNEINSLAVGYHLEGAGSYNNGVQTFGYSIAGTDSTTGTIYGDSYLSDVTFNQAYLWTQYVSDSNDPQNSVEVWASNDGGSNYYQCNLAKTNSNMSPVEYEYFCAFDTVGSTLKTKFVINRGSEFSNVYLQNYGVAWIDKSAGVLGVSGTGTGAMFTASNTALANGDYLEVVHNQNTTDIFAQGWVYDTGSSVWTLIDDQASDEYEITKPNVNTVRLTNNSGSTQNLKLEVITNASTADAGNLSMAPLAADVDSQTNSNSIWINKTGVGGMLLKLQSAASDVLTLTKEGVMSLVGSFTATGDIESSAGDIKTNGEVRINNDGSFILGSMDSAPSGAVNGQMYYNTNDNKFHIYKNGAWETIDTTIVP